MKALPVWEDALKNVKPTKRENNKYVLPKNPNYYRNNLTHVSDLQGVMNLIEFALQRPLSHIGFDTEYQFGKPAVSLKGKKSVYDIRSTVPLLLSLTLAEYTDDENLQLYDFVVDLRMTNIIPSLQQVFELPVCFVGHNIKVELFCLWQLGLKKPSIIWDTFIYEKALSLGKYNKKYLKSGFGNDIIAEIRATELKKDTQRFSFSLVATCQRYGVPFGMYQKKQQLQESFLRHELNKDFSQEQIKYSAEDSHAAACLYMHQVQSSAIAGILNHFVTVEMPWTITNATMQWRGLRISEEKKKIITPLLQKEKQSLEKQITQLGLNNYRSHKQLKDFFAACELLHHFQQDGRYSFDKDQIKRLKHLHPVLKIMSQIRRISVLLNDQILSNELIGIDGRIHPEHIQLGTDTGRQTSKCPNILGMDQLMRPLITPSPGKGICEVDWAQKEIGVAAAVYRDKNLLEMFNSGDVYTAMAKQFFESHLPDNVPSLSDEEFKTKYSNERNKMKTCTLGMLYGMKPYGLAKKLRVSEIKARSLQRRFLNMFPQMQENIRLQQQSSIIRGYASTVSGLRRYKGGITEWPQWELNWLANHPIQGSAAVIFKVAGNRLHNLFKKYDAHLLIPLHDSFVFEAPLDLLEEVAKETEKIMCKTVQDYFPLLKPRAEINLHNPSCWNKDGNSNALENWLTASQ